jgi:tRNA1Val (adenine37-N6)-methyltransferase
MIAPVNEETVDTILGGRLQLVQPKRGYRFSIDAILLGRFASCRPGARVLELGAGCGVVSMMIATLHRPSIVTALEIQPSLASMIERNARLNRLDKITAVEADLRLRKIAHVAPAAYDLVLANPPYRRVGSGRQSPNAGRRLARDESAASLRQFIVAAARYVIHGGRVAMIFTAERSAELLAELRAHRLEPKRIRMVHPRIDIDASTILVEARRGAGLGVEIEPPLVLYAAKGTYSAEARSMLALE